MEKPEYITTVHPIGNTTMELVRETYRIRREILDTEVRIGGNVLCVINGSNISEFLFEFGKVIDKYRI
jgi:hypothetical protein